MTKQLRLNALPRVLVWTVLTGMSLYIGIRIAAGPGRDITYDRLEWTTFAVIQVVALTALFAGVFARAAYLTYFHEVKAPHPDVIRFPGGTLSFFADGLMSVTGGLLMLVAIFMFLHLPETILASGHPLYRNHHTAQLSSVFGPGITCGLFGFVLMLVRRSIWEIRPGTGIVRYWSRSFGRARTVPTDIMLYWDRYYGQQGNTRVPVAWCLHGAVDKRSGFELVLVALDTPVHVLEHILDDWRLRLSAVTAGYNRIIARSPYESDARIGAGAAAAAPL